ncbi:hypothetical protein [Geothrix alkalitolerans]|uniref:hypothetical protein n=1 Tax=Geothrix alkalitolerans TaxID=2922724 RepID=UPI001FAE9095|nr:hypothetical protein [Geothrix alkalitolerans]
MDGQNFQWQLPTLLYYATRRPTVEVLAQKRSGWGKGKEKRFQIELQKLEAPVDPSAAEVEDTTTLEQVLQPLGPQLAEPALWRTLARLRSSTPRFAPIPVVLEGRTWWVVRGAPAAQRSHAIGLDPNRQPRWLIRGENAQIPGATERQDLAFLEFWEADPCGDAAVAAPAFLCAEPPDQVLKGRLLRLRGHWFEVAEAALDPGSGRLAKFRVEPWKADALSLLRGELPARNLDPSAPVADLAALEQLGNEALIEWKTRALPGLLATLTVNPAEDLVIRLEKGILDLDLTAKRLRARLDEEARAEVARKAQAELAAKRGQAAPIAQGASTEDLELVADLLDQRKAILMAVLGNAKQALASLRR